MAFWGGYRLKIEGKQNAIVSDFDEGQIDCSAYTLTMGCEAYVTPGHGENLRESKKLSLNEPKVQTSGNKKIRYGGGNVVIPSGQFAFLLTEESVSIPKNAMGFISLKSGIKFRGLINVSGFHVDPGFKGRLIYSVYNAGPSPITIARGDDLFLLWMSDLSGKTVDEYTKSNAEQLEISSHIISTAARENHSLQALSTKVDNLTRQISIVKAVAIGLAAGLSAIAAIAGIKAWIWPATQGTYAAEVKVGIIEPPLASEATEEKALKQK